MKVMTTKEILSDIPLMSIRVEVFPSGIEEAFRTLMKKLPDSTNRVYYGISSTDKSGKLVYDAAVVEAYPGEAEKLGLANNVVQKGRYSVARISDWRSRDQSIPDAFGRLMANPETLHGFPCVEKYDHTAADVECMVRVK